ncbi:uncharacterized protein LOC114521140 [Dendronephthya gigantea]|uniref:uncharacterized protein LOC114521140 n=1 Tax=Dendronephthya gigantea TaxID=151771 RepID=UPI00106D0C5C|nr:uncharacterized protein LOC114521140 [Dendronephthya gigantea]
MAKMISCVGRPFGLGMLYDRRSDKLILGKTLWSPDHLNAALDTILQPFTNSKVFTENTVEDKTSALDIEASLKLSFLSGLVNVEGAAKYLNDTKTSKHQCRVVLKYETTTELKQLTMEHLGKGKIQYPEVFDTDMATDVVVGILYGAKAFMVFDKEVSKNESVKEVHGNMDVLVKSLAGISVDGHGSVDITEDQKKNSENMRCQMYGDFRTNESPTNYEDAVKIYKQLPSLIGENGEKAVPIKVYLCPLSAIDSKCQRMVREISSNLVNKTAEIQEHLLSVIAICNDLAREEICFHFPRLGRQLKDFLKTIELYKVFLQKKILAVLRPQIRGGGVEETALAQIIQEKEMSPFSSKALEHWLDCKKQEMKKLQGIIRSIKETPVVNPEAVENELYDPDIKFILCCTFKIACEEDEQILKMDAYVNDSEVVTKNIIKVDEKSTYKKVRETLRHLVILKSVNKEDSSMKILATDEPLPHDYEGETGAFLYFYEDGEIENEDLISQPPPNNLKEEEAGENELRISWNVQAGNDITRYKVQYKDEASGDTWSSVDVESSDKVRQTVILKELKPATKYIIRICAEQKINVGEYSEVLSANTKPATSPDSCDGARESNNKPISDRIPVPKQPATFRPEKILGVCKLVEPPQKCKLAVYTLPLTHVFEDPDLKLRKYEIDLEPRKSRIASVPNKVIMMVGSTGSGKTTTVNAMINYILGVEWEDSFRLKLIHEDSSNQGSESIGKQTCSQTQFVTCYTLPHLKGFKVPYTLTIVDTPGFGDTRGIKHDKIITEQVRKFFETSGDGGIDHIDAICFLAQAGSPRLTHTQRYVFDSILSMFGKDIQKNISVLFTFADGDTPQALPSLQEAGILSKEDTYFPLNNSALFADNSGSNANKVFASMFWSMGMNSFETFFKCLNTMKSRSLVLTKEVLQERAQLEVRVSSLQDRMNRGINTLSCLQQKERIFKQHANDINDNKSFKYTVTQVKRVKVPLPSGTYVTNCPPCNNTCHYPCGIPRSEDKDGCAAMTNGNCQACRGRCHWSVHVNDSVRMVDEYEEIPQEYDGKKAKLEEAEKGYTKVEAEINRLKAEFSETEEIVLSFVAEMQRGLQRLSEIALKKDPLQEVEYLDLLIQSEESQGKPGFMDRVKSLRDTREKAEKINSMATPDYDPWKQYRENKETQKFLRKENERQKPGLMERAYNLGKDLFGKK